MRIMHISTRLILGGSQENTVLSCEGQALRGHEVALVYGPIYGPEGSLLERVKRFWPDAPEFAHRLRDAKLAPPLEEGRGDSEREGPMTFPSADTPGSSPGGSARIEAIETPNLVRELYLIKDLRCYFDLRRLIRDWRPDVVHTHSSKAGILGRLAAWHERVPCVIHTIHGPPFHQYEKKWRNAIYILSERVAAKRCHIIACVADAMREQFLAAKIGRPEQYVTVYSGMEIEPFVHPPADWSRSNVRRELGLRDDDFVAGTVARLAEHKGHDDLLDALGELMRDRPEIKLLWVGDGWWRQRLLARVQSMGLSDRIITTGLVPPEMIPKYMQAMDVLIHPSYREGLPRTVTQALLSAIPAIAYDVDGTREVCIDGQTGRLLAPGDLAGLRDAVLWMMEHPRERTAMGQRGREMCRVRFAASTMVEHLETLYARQLANATGVVPRRQPIA